MIRFEETAMLQKIKWTYILLYILGQVLEYKDSQVRLQYEEIM